MEKIKNIVRQDAFWGYLFIIPTFLGIVIFTLLPVVMSFALSFFDWDLYSSPEFVRFENFQYIFSDPLFYKVCGNTLLFTVLYVPVKLLLALFIANLLNKKIRGVVGFRAIFFMPAITSVVAISFVWAWLYNNDFGLLNIFLSMLGINGPDWLGDKNWAMIAVVIMSVWQTVGYAMVIYLAALQAIPKTLIEAAEIDGATNMTIFWKIKVPMLSATTFFLIITNIFYGLQVFTEVFVLTEQGPADATNVLATYMYDYAFRFQNIGVASAVACMLFILMALITMFQFRFSKWVHYD
jgi:multiple sugar transport system permease protein